MAARALGFQGFGGFRLQGCREGFRALRVLGI